MNRADFISTTFRSPSGTYARFAHRPMWCSGHLLLSPALRDLHEPCVPSGSTGGLHSGITLMWFLRRTFVPSWNGNCDGVSLPGSHGSGNELHPSVC